jgi:RNA polymerase subunit RPABC4/transcription elongation factor Spt4
MEKERHGFVTFWLVLCVIFCSISSFIYLFHPGLVQGTTGFSTLSGLIMAFLAVCYILLLCWKKIGFWLFIVAIIIQIPLGVNVGFTFGQTLFGIVSIAILWGILHIRKNGISTWDYLSTNYNNEKQYSQSTNKKCRQCNTIYSGSSCPKCGSSLYEEVQESTTTRDDNNVEKKKCRNCNKLVPADLFKCPDCGNDTFL